MDSIESKEVDFKAEFERERAKRLQLEEECDLLALDNVRLREENEQLKKQLTIQLRLNTLTEGVENITIANNSSLGDFVEDGDDLYPNRVLRTISNACDGKNVIAVTYCCGGKYVLCAGGDNSVHLYNASNVEAPVVWTQKLSAPATCLEPFGSLVVCSLFDGSLVLVRDILLI